MGQALGKICAFGKRSRLTLEIQGTAQRTARDPQANPAKRPFPSHGRDYNPTA